MGNPKTIAVVSQKGGAGKTTLALNLAVAAERQRVRSIVLDIDPQGSAGAWADNRDEPGARVEACSGRGLARALSRATGEGVGLALIDTVPHVDPAVLSAARAAALVVIPCRPALLDLHALAGALEIARLAATPAVVVLNAAPARGRLEHEARAVLASAGLEVMGPALGQRAAFVHALTTGQGVMEYEPGGKAAVEVRALLKALIAHRVFRNGAGGARR